MTRDEMIRLYRRYLGACNRRAWDEVAECVAERVIVNDKIQSRSQYIADLLEVTTTFPEYYWQLQRALCEGEWLAVHLSDTGARVRDFMGAPGNGAPVATDEYAMYHIVDGHIIEVEGTADNARLRA
jgi:predicted ester cyclase